MYFVYYTCILNTFLKFTYIICYEKNFTYLNTNSQAKSAIAMYGWVNNFTNSIPLDFKSPLKMLLCESMYLSKVYVMKYGIPCTLAN